MEPTIVSPYVSAEAYRIGREDGFKSGVIAGVVGLLLVEAVRRSRKKGAQRKTKWYTHN